jgi:hypothetical protein
MDLIECIFGISRDGGSGMLEWLLLLMPVAVIAVRERAHLTPTIVSNW